MKPDTVHDLKKREFARRYDWVTGQSDNRCVFEDLSMNLPIEASIAGMTLSFELPQDNVDPIFLKDRYGNVLYEWEKPPSLEEVREIALENLGR